MSETTVPAHEVVQIPAYGAPGRDELKQQCFDVRIDVFVHEQGFPLEDEIDAYVRQSLRPLALSNGGS